MSQEQIQAPVKLSKKASLTRTAFGVASTIALVACQVGERIGFVTPTPEGIKNDPTETVPPMGSTREFAGRLIGEAGIGRVSGLIQNENPDATYITEITNRAFEAFKVEDPSLDQNRIEVYAFEIQGETGSIPFPLVSISSKENKDIVDSVFVGFGLDENGVLVPPEEGKAEVFLRLNTIPRDEGVVFIGVQDQNDPEAIYLPPLFEVNQGTGEILFNSPYGEIIQGIQPVRVSGPKAEFALMPMPEWTRTLAEGLIPVRDENNNWTIGFKDRKLSLVSINGLTIAETGLEIEMKSGQILNIPLEEIDTRLRVNESGAVEVVGVEGNLQGIYEGAEWALPMAPRPDFESMSDQEMAKAIYDYGVLIDSQLHFTPEELEALPFASAPPERLTNLQIFGEVGSIVWAVEAVGEKELSVFDESGLPIGFVRVGLFGSTGDAPGDRKIFSALMGGEFWGFGQFTDYFPSAELEPGKRYEIAIPYAEKFKFVNEAKGLEIIMNALPYHKERIAQRTGIIEALILGISRSIKLNMIESMDEFNQGLPTDANVMMKLDRCLLIR